jgi:DNA-directed RNA polymerase subunit K/omega
VDPAECRAACPAGCPRCSRKNPILKRPNLTKEIRIGPPKLTRFERARIVGARALQISLGAPILVDLPTSMSDPIDIALRELKEGVLPITLRRVLPDNTHQDIALSELLESRAV